MWFSCYSDILVPLGSWNSIRIIHEQTHLIHSSDEKE